MIRVPDGDPPLRRVSQKPLSCREKGWGEGIKSTVGAGLPARGLKRKASAAGSEGKARAGPRLPGAPAGK